MRYKLILFLLFAMPCWSQSTTTTTGKAETEGPCSPAVTGNNNTFTINCGISKEQGQKMLALMNKVLAKGVDTNAVLSKIDEKVDEIIANQERQSEAIGKIKGQQGPWLLDPTIQQKMFDTLKNAPMVPVIVESQIRSTQNFYQGIVAVFQELRWIRSGRVTESSSAAPIIGIRCYGQESLRDSMAQIETALQFISSNIHCIAVPENRISPYDKGSVIIIVGERP